MLTTENKSVLLRPSQMTRTETTLQRVTRATSKGNVKIDPYVLKGLLLSRRSSLSKWANDHGYHRTQISKALHGHRTDRRSQEILAALEKEINQ